VSKRVILAQHARKTPAPPAPNRHERRSPLDGAAVMAALARIEEKLDAALELVKEREE
jgi:hypothetical protein